MIDFRKIVIFRYCDLRKIPIHTHEMVEIVYYEKGSGVTNIGDKTYYYEPNTYSVTPPNHPMNEIHHSSTTPWCVLFYAKDIALEPGVYKDTADRKIFGIIKQILMEYNDSRPMRTEVLNAICTQLVVEIVRMMQADYAPRSVFAKILQEMEYSCLQPVKIEDYAKKTGYSYHHFRHLFKKFYGISPQKYLTRCRIKYAKSMLEQGKKYTATYISDVCQFSNYNQFRIQFEKETGMSPKEYRKNAQETTLG